MHLINTCLHLLNLKLLVITAFIKHMIEIEIAIAGAMGLSHSFSRHLHRKSSMCFHILLFCFRSYKKWDLTLF